MNNDTKNIIKEILYIVIAVTLSIFAVKFIIWLLPFILFALISHYLYKSIKKNHSNINVTKESQKSKTANANKTKKKEIKIIDMETND